MNLVTVLGLGAIAVTLLMSIRWALFTEDLPLSLAALLCLMRWRHNPRRRPAGGFGCEDCGFLGSNLDEFGFTDGGYVTTGVRRVYDRDRGEFTRTSAWQPTERGW